MKTKIKLDFKKILAKLPIAYINTSINLELIIYYAYIYIYGPIYNQYYIDRYN